MASEARRPEVPVGRLESLQALRFFAALAVAVYHARSFYEVTGGRLDVRSWTNLNFAGVDVFFVISGFIMWITTRNANGGADALSFAARRAARIYSTWFLVAAAALLVTALRVPKRLAEIDIPRSLLLVPQSHATNLYDVTWTLSYELYFYAMMALAILLGGRRLIVLFFAAVAVLYALRVSGHPLVSSRFVTGPMIAEFALGCLVAAFVERRRVVAPWVWIGLGLAGLAATAAWQARSGVKLASGDFRELRVLLVGPCAAALVLGFAGLGGGARFPPLLVRLGDASYGIYLWHGVCFGIVRRFLVEPTVGKLPPVAAEIVWLLALAFVCWLSLQTFRFVERPLAARVRAFFKRQAAPAAPAIGPERIA